ncbi:MAG: Eco57I restriction-modification methylase domain-containing protein [Streptosporangiaceae bacterium]
MVRRRRPAGGVSEEIRRRHAWLELLQTSGPFLTLPVVQRAFPDGLPSVPADKRAEIRAAVAGMLDDRGATRHAVIETTLRDILDWQDHLRIDTEIPDTLAEPVPGHAVLLRPDFGFYAETSGADDADEDDEEEDDAAGEDAEAEDGDAAAADGGPLSAAGARGPWKLLGMYLPWGTHPLARVSTGGWTASGVERLAVLLRSRQVPVGLATDGRWWALVWAPPGGTTGAAVWDAGLFSEDPASLRAFAALLQRSRFLAVAAGDTLPALFAESLERGEEVTETLGQQVRQAVGMLIATMDRLDRETGGRLLDGVRDDELYAGVVTVMMRVVFLLFAEERRLLPGDDDIYISAYGVSQLVSQLERQASLAGEQTLEHRTAAWHRLLALTRAIHSGVAHEDLRLPAYGGGLFDPDRYPWLEGRRPGDAAATSRPPAVDDRTVLRILRAVQYVQIGGERRRLTFRALDVEQIGYVYEGLLELEVRTATDVMVNLIRPANWPRRVRHDTEVPLRQILAWYEAGELAARVAERTGWSPARTRMILGQDVTADDRAAVSRALGPHMEITGQIAPVFHVLRKDERGLPAITPAGGRYVTRGAHRAATGTHYTPRFLAEEVAIGALGPLVYRPGPLETADDTTWRLRPSSEILQLRVADIAMGSGAFLVAACRYLADRLVEAWRAEGRADAIAARQHQEAHRIGADAEAEQVLLEARRQIAEHCLYGADINQLAVEMAKLSLWLITMDRERPFGFLDDRLVGGDSLLGLATMDQLEFLHPDPGAGRRINAGTLDFAQAWRPRLQAAADLRRQITAAPVVTIRDVEHKAWLLAEASTLSGTLTAVADAITAEGLAAARLTGGACDAKFITLAHRVSIAMDDGSGNLATKARETIQAGQPAGTEERRPLHWPLVFPEIFADTDRPGFDAIIGNPPFLGGQKLSGTLGDDYLGWLQRWDGNGVRGSADLAARFLLRTVRLLSQRGQLGLVTVNTLIEGATLRVGMEQATEHGLIIRAGRSPHPWPTSSASLQIIETWAGKTPLGRQAVHWLDGEEVPDIGPDLQPYGRIRARPQRLRENEDIAFIGSYVLGLGFTMEPEQAQELILSDYRNDEVLQPYVIGKDLNQRPDCSPSRWIINFRDWPLERAELYPDCIDIVRRLVKPERDRKREADRRINWWRYCRRAVDLYEAIKGLDRVLAISLVSNAVMPVRVPTGLVFSHMTAVFALDDFASLAVLSSSVHSIWTVRYASTLETRTRYAPSDVFLTLPRPALTPVLAAVGEELDRVRRELMLGRSWGNAM